MVSSGEIVGSKEALEALIEIISYQKETLTRFYVAVDGKNRSSRTKRYRPLAPQAYENIELAECLLNRLLRMRDESINLIVMQMAYSHCVKIERFIDRYNIGEFWKCGR